MKRDEVVFDLEISPNYFLCGFKKLDGGKVLQIDTQTSLSREQIRKIKSVLRQVTIIGFNSTRYDIPMLLKALEGASTLALFKMSKTIIEENLPNFITMQRFDIETVRDIDHFDVSESAPAVFVSLKGYGARLHSKKLQDLPYAYDKVLSDSEIEVIKKYNVNDLDTTIDLYNAIAPRIRLREEMGKEYKLDLRSKSDAQIAELVIVTELARKGIKATRPVPPKIIRYKAPSCVEFKTDQLKSVLEFVEHTSFKINPKNGQPVLPDFLKKLKIVMGETKYQVGLGGLHSKEKKMVVIPKEDEVLRNIDVKSYYPSMILEFGFFPKRLTDKFLDVYGKIYGTRNDPKKGAKVMESILKKDIKTLKKDTVLKKEMKDKLLAELEEEFLKVSTISGGFKIVLNGSFGKLGSMYSKLYAPDLMLQVTLTGQLMLLMLIEELEEAGISVKSSNTDGVEIVCPKSKEALLEAIVFDWELNTGMVMEHGHYKALYARDVNNYVAVYDGYTKTKGVYSEPSLMKNSEYPIVFKAIREYLLNGTPLLQTITECKDVRQFLTARTVKGGGVWNVPDEIHNTKEYEEYRAEAMRDYGGFGSGRGAKDEEIEARNLAFKQEQLAKGEYLGKVVRWYYAEDGKTIHYKTNGNKVPKSDGAKPLMNLGETLEENVFAFPTDLDYHRYLELAIGHLEDTGATYDMD